MGILSTVKEWLTPRVPGVSTNRKIEWFAALNLLIGGVMFALPGYTLEAWPVYHPLREAGWTDASVAAVMTGVGTFWCMALWVNGHWRRSPIVRSVGALMGALIWGQVACLQALFAWQTGVASLGCATYSLLAGACLLACFRTAADAVIVGGRGAGS